MKSRLLLLAWMVVGIPDLVGATLCVGRRGRLFMRAECRPSEHVADRDVARSLGFDVEPFPVLVVTDGARREVGRVTRLDESLSLGGFDAPTASILTTVGTEQQLDWVTLAVTGAGFVIRRASVVFADPACTTGKAELFGELPKFEPPFASPASIDTNGTGYYARAAEKHLDLGTRYEIKTGYGSTPEEAVATCDPARGVFVGLTYRCPDVDAFCQDCCSLFVQPFPPYEIAPVRTFDPGALGTPPFGLGLADHASR